MSLPNVANDKDTLKRVDPVVDAYRQASTHERAGPKASVRVAVLAHAQVVAVANANGKPNTARTARDVAAANDHSWMWRAAAGLVLGVLGVLMFQWVQPASTSADTTVAASSAPAPASGSVVPSQTAPASPAPVAPVASAAPAASAEMQTPPKAVAHTAIATAPTIEAKTPAAQADTPTVSDKIALATARDTAVGRTSSKAAASPPATNTNAAEPRVAAAPVMVADAAVVSPASAAAPRAEAPLREETAVAMAKRARVADVTERQSKNEDSVASVRGVAAETSRYAAGASVAPAAAAPVASGAMASSAALSPVPAPAAAPAAPPAPARALNTPDADLLRAIRQNDPMSLRAAIARGANVNAKNEVGRSALQLARDENRDTLVEILLAAGAK
jgi:hypothetical protein